MEYLERVIEQIRDLMEKEDRKDAEFRALIADTEFGDIEKYLTHDPILNPGARPHGTRAEEELAYGQLLVQIIALMGIRGIDVFRALNVGLKNWQEADWRKRKQTGRADGEEINGVGACSGSASGLAYVLSPEHSIEEMPEGVILVTKFVKPDIARYLKKAVAIITDQGGRTSHAAIITRELGIPCIVGTGNATERIVHGSPIRLEITNEKATVYIKKI